MAVSLDVTNVESIKNVCKATYDTYGSIDVLVNNVSLSPPPPSIYILNRTL